MVLPQRNACPWLRQFDDFTAAGRSGIRSKAIDFFHVFEHLEEPSAFLRECAALLAPGGHAITEIPALTDPSRGLYDIAAYQDFNFQRQHPYVYSGNPLARVLKHNGFKIQNPTPYQRYGIENHLLWLDKGVPGGNEEFRRLFTQIDDGYRAALEASAKTDTFISVAEIVA